MAKRASTKNAAGQHVVEDYRLAFKSRVASVLGRREVMVGKAKFGIFGDGKEVAQIALAKTFQPGDWRAGYYRDQTMMLATGMTTLEEWFAQLYADTSDPASAGRQMNSHFSTRNVDENGRFLPIVEMKNSSADLSPTGAQMSKMVGLAYASKLYRANPDLGGQYSRNGDEVAFGTIGNASTSEGIFWEAMNAAGVLQIPMAVSVWDDGYGISVPNEHQTTKSSISAALAGFQRGKDGPGFEIIVAKGWDYPGLVEAYKKGIALCRKEHVPVLFHITEVTQPQGHSTSGSHERYKNEERLRWESEFDCITKMREWMVEESIATAEEIDEWEKEDRAEVESIRKQAWEDYQAPIRAERDEVVELLRSEGGFEQIIEDLQQVTEVNRKMISSALFKATLERRSPKISERYRTYREENLRRYNSHLFSEGDESPLKIDEKKPVYSDSSETVDGRVVIQRCFDYNFKKDARIFAVGEDIGVLGDVNLVFEGLQEKYGELRVTDTGIREATILGQGIGAALRGLRPIVDIQYLDYLLYAMQILSDDLATLHWRTAGGQKAPVVIRTKGHRLQGIWHTGSPMSMILGAARGVYLCVPRDMTRAAGMYNTLFKGDNPAIVIEVLSGYRLKEMVPDNVGSFTVPLGVPEVLREGSDITIVTYGALCRLAMQAASTLEGLGISTEVIDVQTLSPFDTEHRIVRSLQKTNAVLFLDEDVPGGATAYMMQKVLEEQEGWQWLDAAPATLPASENRSAFAVDGDHFTKPSVDDIVERVYSIVGERRPRDLPPL